jgi:glycosyltransferase involved in cell wall biosynthesis
MSAATSNRGPLVSVAIPVYNGESTVAQAINSLLDQTYPDLEIIVVDDGSTDGTWGVLQSFGASIKAIRQSNGGIAAARNTGVQAANGEFIALMDHDDLCEPERISVQVRFLMERRQVVLCCSDFSAFADTGPISGSHIANYYSSCSANRGGVIARYSDRGKLDISDSLPTVPSHAVVVPVYFGQVYDELALGNFVHPPTVMFRRGVLENAGPFEPGTRSSADWAWLVKVSRIGAIGFIDRPLLKYRLSATQMSALRDPTDALKVARRICERDPALVGRQPRRFRKFFGELTAEAADEKADKQPVEAFSLLATSIFRYRTWSRQTPRTLFKILAPRLLLQFLRALRERRGNGTDARAVSH